MKAAARKIMAKTLLHVSEVLAPAVCVPVEDAISLAGAASVVRTFPPIRWMEAEFH